MTIMRQKILDPWNQKLLNPQSHHLPENRLFVCSMLKHLRFTKGSSENVANNLVVALAMHSRYQTIG